MSLSRLLSLFSVSFCLFLIASGCAAPASRGWSGAILHGGTIYIGSMQGKVLALNPSARSREAPFPSQGEWVFATRAPVRQAAFTCAPPPPPAIYGTPEVAGGLVYVGTYAGKVYALNSINGAARWVYPREGYETVGSIVGEVVTANNNVYFGSSNGVYALDAVTGDLKWQLKTGGKVWTSPAVGGGVVYVGSFDGKLHALSSEEGKELWNFRLPAAVASSPVVWEDAVIIGSFDGHLHCIVSGKERWKFRGGSWFWARPFVSKGVVYAGCLDGKAYALEVGTGEKLWQFGVDSPIASSPLLMGDLLIVASEAGKLHFINASTGELVRNVSLGSPVVAPLYGEGDIVYVHARNGYLYAVKIPGGEIAWKFSLAVKEG